jgi:hypothetical protein
VFNRTHSMAVVWRHPRGTRGTRCSFPFCHRSSDQDYPEIAPNDVDGLVTSRKYLVYNSWYRKVGAFRELVPGSASSLLNPYRGNTSLHVYSSVHTSTVCSLKHPWSSPKNFRSRHCRRSNLDQNLPRITNPVSDMTGD